MQGLNILDLSDNCPQLLAQRDEELAFAAQFLARFSYGMSHELLAPVNTLNKLLNLFKEEAIERLDEDSEELLDMIMTSAKRTLEVTQGLQEFSRYSQAPDKLEQIATGDVVCNVLEQMQADIDQKKAVVTIGELPDALATADRLHQLFFQLIKNALLYVSTDTGSPQLFIDGYKADNTVTFTVADQGIGVDPDNAQSVFTVFKRLHARSDYEGAGLGLSVCKQIVSSLNGRIWVSTDQQKGATIHVRLPTSSPQHKDIKT